MCDLAMVRSEKSYAVCPEKQLLVSCARTRMVPEIAERIRQEVTMYGIRIDITEELQRLAAHLAETRHVLQKGGKVGKRLDFMMQELNREANTLGSKSVDTEVTQVALDLKLLIEQMREQIQDIE